MKPDRNGLLKAFELESYREKVYHYLLKRHHLPLLRVFDLEAQNEIERRKAKIANQSVPKRSLESIDFENLNRFLKLFFKLIDTLRNRYSHAIALDLQNLNYLEDRTMDLEKLIGSQDDAVFFAEILQKLFEDAAYFAFEKYNLPEVVEDAKAENEKKTDSQKIEKKKTTFNSDLADKLKYVLKNKEQIPVVEEFKSKNKFSKEDFDKVKTESLLFQLQNNEPTQVFTTKGFAFLICLCLEEKQAINLLKQIKGMRDDRTVEFRATHKLMANYALKVPDVRFIDDHPNLTLFKQMLAELNKCPHELFSVLPEPEQKLFRAQRLQDFETDQLYEDSPSSGVRSENRFPYFALRFLELTNALEKNNNKLEFQICLGKILLKEPYSKTINGEAVERRLTDEFCVFGRLDECRDETKMLEKVKEKIQTKYKDTVTFEQFSPHYHISNNKIKFRIEIDHMNAEGMQNEGFVSIHDLPKLIIIALLNGNIYHVLNSFFCSNIMNFEYTTKKGITTLEHLEKIKQRYALDKLYRYSFYQKTPNNKTISYRERINERKGVLQNKTYPNKITDYLLNIVTGNKKVHNRLKDMRLEIHERLQVCKKEKLEAKKLKVGEMAQYLAQDFIQMLVKKEVKEKITSIYFDQIQNGLAYYSKIEIGQTEPNRLRVKKICQELGILSAGGHAFLQANFFDKTNLSDFYQWYVERKLAWFDQTFKTKGIDENGKPKTIYQMPKTLPYSMRKIGKDFDIKTWFEYKKNHPIDIPSFYLTKKAMELLSKKVTKDETDKFPRLVEKLVPEFQPFYDWKRIYVVEGVDIPISLTAGKKFKEQVQPFGKAVLQKKKAKNAKTQLNLEAVVHDLKKKVGENEQMIRYQQMQDRLLKLMCEKIVEKLEYEWTFPSENPHIIDLSQIEPESLYNPLDKPIVGKMKLQFGTIYGKDSEVNQTAVKKWEATDSAYKQKYFSLSDAEKNNQPFRAVGYKWTVRTLGRLDRMRFDRRLKGILQFMEAPVEGVPYELLEYEFQEYENVRETIFSKVFKLEEFLWDYDSDEIISEELKERNEGKNFPQVQFEVFLAYLESQSIASEIRELLKEVRNKFAHNQFPGRMGLLANIEKLTQEQMQTFHKNYGQENMETYYPKSIGKKICAMFVDNVDAVLGIFRQKRQEETDNKQLM